MYFPQLFGSPDLLSTQKFHRFCARQLFDSGIISTSFDLLSNITPTASLIADSTKDSPIVYGLPAFVIRKLIMYKAMYSFFIDLGEMQKLYFWRFNSSSLLSKKLEWATPVNKTRQHIEPICWHNLFGCILSFGSASQQTTHCGRRTSSTFH